MRPLDDYAPQSWYATEVSRAALAIATALCVVEPASPGIFAREAAERALRERRASEWLAAEDRKVRRCRCGAWAYGANRCRACRRGIVPYTEPVAAWRRDVGLPVRDDSVAGGVR